MIILDPKLSFRIGKILDMRYDEDQRIEIIGLCSLTGKVALRFFHPTTGIMEFNETTETWVNILDGMTKGYINEFAKVCMPHYQNNVLEYRKIEKVIEDDNSGIKSESSL